MRSREPWSAADRRWLVLLLVGAVGLRLPGHLDSGLWFDEIWLLVETIRQPFWSFYTTFGSDNNHPFYSLLAWLSVHGLGESAWTLRLPALLFGVASVGMMWVLARRVTDRTEALVATGLMVVSYHHVWFSQNARGYTMLLFWTLAATHVLLQVFEGARRRDWVLYGVCLALATYTHSSALAVALGHLFASALVVLRPESRSRLTAVWHPFAGLALAGVISLLLHATILPEMAAYLLGGAGGEVGEGGPVASEWNSPWWTIRAVAESLGFGLMPGLVAMAGGTAVLVAGTVEYFRRDWRVAVLFLLPAVFGVVMTVGLGRPLRPRFFFNLAGFILLILVSGGFALAKAISSPVGEPRGTRVAMALRSAFVVAVFAGSLLILPRAYLLPKQDFEGALEWARTVPMEDDAVAVTGLTVLPYDSYFRAGFPEVRTVEELRALQSSSTDVYVLHTLPIYLESRSPELAALLASADEVARFPGSLGAGDVVVLRFPGTGGA